MARWGGATKTPGAGLTLDSVTAASGSDPVLGGWTGTAVSWSGGMYVTTFKQYGAVPAALFLTRAFPMGANGSAHTHADANDDLAAAFPVLGPPLAQLSTGYGYITWADTMCGGVTGTWTAAGVKASDFGHKGGPVALFNSSLATVVMSSVDSPMVTGGAFAQSTATSWALGVLGLVDPIPAGWSTTSVLYGGQGVNDTMYAWGSLLLGVGGKARTGPSADIVVSTLSYWTDNGE